MIYAVQQVEIYETVKFGHSGDPPDRVRRLQTGNPDQLTLLSVLRGEYCDIEVENAIKEKLASQRVLGGGTEWFYRNDKIDNIIRFMEEQCFSPIFFEILRGGA